MIRYLLCVYYTRMIIPATARLSRLRWEWWLFLGHLKVRSIFLTSVSDPDSFRSGIRIGIQEGKNDPGNTVYKIISRFEVLVVLS